MIRILFVCLGNICRSPLAEGVFRQLVAEKGLTDTIYCDSAGTSDYHIGDLPDHRTLAIARRYGMELTHRARQFSVQDFADFDYIVTMDQTNHLYLLNHDGWQDAFHEKVLRMRTHDDEPDDGNVPDPYFGGMSGFEHVYQILYRTSQRFLQLLIEKHQLKS